MNILQKMQQERELNEAITKLDKIVQEQGMAFLKDFIKKYEHKHKQKREQNYMSVSSSYYLLRCQGNRRKDAIEKLAKNVKISESSVSNHIVKFNKIAKKNNSEFALEVEKKAGLWHTNRWTKYTDEIAKEAQRRGIAYKLGEALFYKYVLDENKQQLINN